MACLVVPAVEGLVVLGVANIILNTSSGKVLGSKLNTCAKNLKSLAGYLLGGAFLLAIEHIWHGEIILSYPFLTAMKSPEETEVMLQEMSTVGVIMAVFVTCVWGISILISLIKTVLFHSKKIKEL
ncbi:MAG: hypothetical protein ACI4V7_04930 [Succinivibrionaceae bacterium]